MRRLGSSARRTAQNACKLRSSFGRVAICVVYDPASPSARWTGGTFSSAAGWLTRIGKTGWTPNWDPHDECHSIANAGWPHLPTSPVAVAMRRPDPGSTAAGPRADESFGTGRVLRSARTIRWPWVFSHALPDDRFGILNRRAIASQEVKRDRPESRRPRGELSLDFVVAQSPRYGRLARCSGLHHIVQESEVVDAVSAGWWDVTIHESD